MIMKRIYYIIFAAVLLLAASCQKPQFIEPTTERQGITSLTAYFTTGKYVDQQLAKLDVTDENMDYYVIEIPWFFPEETEDPTTIYMSNLRIRAELAPDCRIDPPLTVLDLNQENKFTFTNNKGESRDIVITGKRTKFRRTDLISFNVIGTFPCEGFVDNDLRKIYLFTNDDLNGYTAEAVTCVHASIKNPEQLAKPRDYNQPQTITVVAHDGVTETEYTITKENPTKIPYGFNAESAKELFSINPGNIGFPEYTAAVNPSVGVLETKLVISMGDGTAPKYLNGITGVLEGEINLGAAKADGMTSDEAGNLILTNKAAGGETVNIYTTNSLSAAPELYYSFTNETTFVVGNVVRVIGDVKTDARMILTHEGVSGVTTCNIVTELVIRGGQVVEQNVVDYSSAYPGWGETAIHYAKVTPVSVDPANGVMISSYSNSVTVGEDSHYYLAYIDGKMSKSEKDLFDVDYCNWGKNPNSMDAKRYNNATYLAHFITTQFPAWGQYPGLYIYDISNPSTIKTADPVVMNSALTQYNETNAEASNSCGDVVISQSADGFKLFVYYFDHYGQTIGGYSVNCIKM
ncbi:MAG: DUF5018 domain-containing protein [Bacteroidales bacterium]|nr:DUF5018 domain-containing protein [Bacteroidales bacterium]